MIHFFYLFTSQQTTSPKPMDEITYVLDRVFHIFFIHKNIYFIVFFFSLLLQTTTLEAIFPASIHHKVKNQIRKIIHFGK